MTFYVYALLRPGTEAIRYVGKSSNPAKRLASHMSQSAAPAVRDWVREIGFPELRILSSHESEAAALLDEQAWIRKLHSGGLLLNSMVALDPQLAKAEGFSGFGARCAARRKQLRMTQLRLATAIGMLPSGLCRIESADRPGVSAETAVRIARELDCSVEWLVTGEEREVARAAE